MSVLLRQNRHFLFCFCKVLLLQTAPIFGTLALKLKLVKTPLFRQLPVGNLSALFYHVYKGILEAFFGLLRSKYLGANTDFDVMMSLDFFGIAAFV